MPFEACDTFKNEDFVTQDAVRVFFGMEKAPDLGALAANGSETGEILFFGLGELGGFAFQDAAHAVFGEVNLGGIDS